jgi:hypothetical protein
VDVLQQQASQAVLRVLLAHVGMQHVVVQHAEQHPHLQHSRVRQFDICDR